MHTSVTLLPVTFMVFNLLKFGKKKGEIDPRSVHYVKLMRDPTTETVGDTIERLKDMYSVYTTDKRGNKHYEERMSQRFKVLTQQETDAERQARYEKLGLEVQPDGSTIPQRVIGENNEPIITMVDAAGPQMVIPFPDPVMEAAIAAEGL